RLLSRLPVATGLPAAPRRIAEPIRGLGRSASRGTALAPWAGSKETPHVCAKDSTRTGRDHRGSLPARQRRALARGLRLRPPAAPVGAGDAAVRRARLQGARVGEGCEVRGGQDLSGAFRRTRSLVRIVHGGQARLP